MGTLRPSTRLPAVRAGLRRRKAARAARSYRPRTPLGQVLALPFRRAATARLARSYRARWWNRRPARHDEARVVEAAVSPASYAPSIAPPSGETTPAWWTPRRRTAALKALVVLTTSVVAVVFTLRAIGNDAGSPTPIPRETLAGGKKVAPDNATKTDAAGRSGAAAQAETPAPTATAAKTRKVLKTLGSKRVRERARLAKARAAGGQAAATARLDQAYREAASRIRAVTGRPSPEYAALVSALAATADGYAGLRRAILNGNEAAFDGQRKAILDGEAATLKATDAIFG